MLEFSVSRKPGIYEILCTTNDKVYIGQSVRPLGRWKAHRRELRQGIHSNTHLQAAWRLYGEESFRFRVLETVWDPDLRALKELEEIQRNNLGGCCFNSVVWEQRCWTKEERESGISERQSRAAKLRWERDREVLTMSLRSPERIAAIAESKKHLLRKFSIRNPFGSIVTTTNLKRFCKENKLDRKHVQRLLDKTIEWYKGWTHPDTDPIEAKKAMLERRSTRDSKRAKSYRLVSPEGVETTIVNMSKFCRDHGYASANFLALFRGKGNQAYGWTLP